MLGEGGEEKRRHAREVAGQRACRSRGGGAKQPQGADKGGGGCPRGKKGFYKIKIPAFLDQG